jgi:hypothetical protein
VGALRLRRPRGPGGGSPEPRLRDWPAQGKLRRRLAQRTHVQWPRLTGRFGHTAEGLPESQGWCAACGARHTTPTSGPAADRRPGHRAPSGRGARLARGSDPGRGGAAGMAARVRLTGDHPHGVAGMGRECGSRATTPTLCSGATPRWCCGAAPTWCSDVTPTWCWDAIPTWCSDVTPTWCCDAIPTWCWDAIPTWSCGADPAWWSAAAAGAQPAQSGAGVRRPSCACSRRVGPALARASALPHPRPERESAADHPVPDAARVGPLPGGAAQAPAVEADAAQVGLAAAA